MIHTCFSVRDTKSEAFLPPFMSTNVATAIRALADAMRSADHPFALHDQDYTLYRLGDFDDVAGRFSLEAAPVEICRLTEVKGVV